MTMTIVEAVAEIDRLRAQNRWLSGQIEILRSERDSWRAESGR